MENTEGQSSEGNEIQLKAELLVRVVRKHDPVVMKIKARKLMATAKPDSDEMKCYAALYELMDVLN